MLNMDTWVTPNHFHVRDFETFGSLTPDAEFDLVAPVLAYFQADNRLRDKARAALKELMALQHPLVADQSLGAMLQAMPEGLDNRYNALMMAIVEDAAPGTASRIDTWGAFAFVIGTDTNVLCGDAAGFFAFCLKASDVRKRVAQALEG